MTHRLLQHRAPDGRRRLILAEDNAACFLSGPATMRELAPAAIAAGRTLADAAHAHRTSGTADLVAGLEAGRLLAAIDHPDVRTRAGDVFEIAAAPFALPLRNTLAAADAAPVTVRAL